MESLRIALLIIGYKINVKTNKQTIIIIIIIIIIYYNNTMK